LRLEFPVAIVSIKILAVREDGALGRTSRANMSMCHSTHVHTYGAQLKTYLTRQLGFKLDVDSVQFLLQAVLHFV
jgi:hypothetical protein